jgi:exodeoxyribonuclease V
MEKSRFIKEVSGQMTFLLNEDQLEAVDQIYNFLFTGGQRSAFILRGYAGTGKTTLMGALIRWFHSVKRKTVLMAPTGRSAKVLASHSGYSASTIHRKIYAFKQDEFGKFSMQLNHNKAEKTMFIVDEASMIGDGGVEDGSRGRSLLDDLLEFVYSGERCRLILIGDDAQLPPVGMELSPALDKKRLSSLLRGPVFQTVLTHVVRQEETSLILKNATAIRQNINEKNFKELKIETRHVEDVFQVEPDELEDRLSSAFNRDSSNESIIICRSNKDANAFNHQIRNRILMRETEIDAGDRLMIVKNNYFWRVPGRRQNFLANGDMLHVDRVHALQSFGPFRFAECQVRFADDDEIQFDLILLLNSIDFDGPSIPSKELWELRKQMIESGDVDANDPEEKFFKNPYFNAVQVKYAYAVTCHKSQGGQWTNVFIFQGYLTEEMLDRSYFRWLYTAITRATDRIMLIGFHPQFIADEN